MTDMERLIEAMKNSLHRYIGEYYTLAENLADDILADGWIRPPCKVGTTVFCIVDGFDRVMEGRVKFYTVHSNCIIYEVAIDGYFAQRYNNTDFGCKIFFAREEAEKALRGGEK